MPVPICRRLTDKILDQLGKKNKNKSTLRSRIINKHTKVEKQKVLFPTKRATQSLQESTGRDEHQILRIIFLDKKKKGRSHVRAQLFRFLIIQWDRWQMSVSCVNLVKREKGMRRRWPQSIELKEEGKPEERLDEYHYFQSAVFNNWDK